MIVEVPKETRVIKTVITLAATIIVTAYFAFILYARTQVGFMTLWALPFLCLGLLTTYRCWHTTHGEKFTEEERQEMQAKMLEDHQKQNEQAMVLFTLSLLLCAPLILGWQCWQYLKFGEWHPLTIITLLGQFGSEWAQHPTDWYGLYTVLKLLPLSLAVFIAGIVFSSLS